MNQLICLGIKNRDEDIDFTPTIVPEGAGSLAEAIVSADTTAALSLIGNRPMFSLADAASDLDAIVKKRAGREVRVSKLLDEKTSSLTEAQLRDIIDALTSALDGTYTSEQQAVKMAIMKAVSIVTHS